MTHGIENGEPVEIGSGKLIRTPEQIRRQTCERLVVALQSSGDFPSHFKVIGQIRAQAANPNFPELDLCSTILLDPAFTIRVLSGAQPAPFSDGAPVLTMVGAITRLGREEITKLASSVVTVRETAPSSRQHGGVFALALQRMLLCSTISQILSVKLAPPNVEKGTGQIGYIAGIVAELGQLLLSYYYPEEVKRLKETDASLEQIIFELTGMGSAELSLELAQSLGLPSLFRSVIFGALWEENDSGDIPMQGDSRIVYVTKAVHTACRLTELILDGSNSVQYRAEVVQLCHGLNMDPTALRRILREIPPQLTKACEALNVRVPSLSSIYIDPCAPFERVDKGIFISAASTPSLREATRAVKMAVDRKEGLLSVVITSLEQIVWQIGYDRAFLFLRDDQDQSLVGRIGLGSLGKIRVSDLKFFPPAVSNDTETLMRNALSPELVSSDLRLFSESVMHVYIPIRRDEEVIGAIYADRTSKIAKDCSDERSALEVFAKFLNQTAVADGEEFLLSFE